MIKLLIILFLTSIIYPNKLDSLLNNAKSPREKYNILIEASQQDSNKLTAIGCANKARKISENLDKEDLLNALFVCAKVNNKFLHHKVAIDNLFDAFTVAESLDDPNSVIKAYKEIGNIYLSISDYEQATEYFILGVKYSEDQMIFEENAKFFQSLGKLNYELKNYDKSISYYLKALELGIELEDYKVISGSRLGLGRAYFNLGELERAESNLKSVIKLNKHLESEDKLALTYNYLGKVATSENNLRQAKKYFANASDLYNINNQNDLTAEILIDLGRFYSINGDTKKAETALLNGYQISQKLNSLYLLKKSSSQLSEFYETQNQYEKANNFLKINQSVNDKLFEINRQRIIDDALVEFETGDIEKENSVLQKKLFQEESEKQKIQNQNLRNLLVLTVLLSVTIIIIFIFYYRYRVKNKANIELQTKNIEIAKLNNQLISSSYNIQKINKELVESEKLLQESNDSKDKFFSIIAHDLKNPISGLLMAIDLIVTYHEKLTKEQVIEKVKELNKTVNTLRQLLENLLEWARTQTGSIDFKPENFNLDEKLQFIKSLYEQNLQQKSINFDINACDINVCADPKMIDTVLRNIISNSIKFTPNNGQIKIFCQENNQKVNLVIQDNGVGIPDDKIESIFDITKKHSTLGTNKEKGTGLGLAICKEFIEINEGDISVESSYGEFTKFSIQIPLSNDKS